MIPAIKKYSREMSVAIEHLANWPVGSVLTLGTIGVIDDHLFTPLFHLKDLSISFDVIDGLAHDDFSHASTSSSGAGVEISAKLPSLVTPIGATATTAGIIVSFRSEYAVAVRASRMTTSRISNQVALMQAMVDLSNAGQWDLDWHVVTQVIDSTSFTALIGGSSSSSAELTVSAQVAGPLSVDVLDASLSPKITASSGMSASVITNDPCTPFFQAKRMKWGFWSGRAGLVGGAYVPANIPASTSLADVVEDVTGYTD